MSDEEEDVPAPIGTEGLADKVQAVVALLQRRRHQVARRDALIREAVCSLLQPVAADSVDSAKSAVPRPLSQLIGLRATVAWQRVVARRWLIAVDLINDTPSEVPHPSLLVSAAPDHMKYESRLVSLPFTLEEGLGRRPSGGLAPGDTLRMVASVDVPVVAGEADSRLSLMFVSPPGHTQLGNDVDFYQLTAGDVTLTADDLLSRRLAPFRDLGVAPEDVQAVWALSCRSLRLWLEPRQPVSLAAAQDRLKTAGFVAASAALTLTDPGHPLFACLVLLSDGDSANRLSVNIWIREDGQLPLLLHQLHQLFGPGCHLHCARRRHTADDLRAALVAQLQFVESRLDGIRVGPERRALRLGDIHLPVAEYVPWRRRLTELEDVTAACALSLVQPDDGPLC